MKEFEEIKKILYDVKSRIETHLKFKKEYDKQLALDFSLFQFFSVGENKISQVLAYFLDEKQNHGQGNIFLKEFVKLYCEEEVNFSTSLNICEKRITENRRLDIYIELENLTIAIENKIWSDDQPNQLQDYANFLNKKSQGNYILFYLNPYGLEPSLKSINDKLKEDLIKQKKLKIISYKHDIINLLNNWLVLCEADNVTHFLKEFKKFLEIKFLGKNTLNMSKELRNIIYANEREVLQLVNEYKQIENEILNKINVVGKELDKINLEIEYDVVISKSGTFNWEHFRVYKYSISKNGNKIWIQFVKDEIHFLSNYYLQDGTDTLFNEILSELNINRHTTINHNLSTAELVSIFLSQVKIAIESFRIYDERMISHKAIN